LSPSASREEPSLSREGNTVHGMTATLRNIQVNGRRYMDDGSLKADGDVLHGRSVENSTLRSLKQTESYINMTSSASRRVDRSDRDRDR